VLRWLTAFRRLDVRLATAFLIVVVVLIVNAFQDDPLETARAEAARIAADEVRAHDAWRQIWATAGPTWDEDEVTRIEQEVLPPWRAARRRLESLRSGATARYFPEELVAFFRLREESWVALIDAVRSEDPELLARHTELFARAEIAGKRVIEIRQRQAEATRQL